jgi:glycosyltransferase involved in cell wall biosynthesis
VIVPAYNVEGYVLECLESVLAQTLGEIEVLVADDASTDETRRMIDSMQDSRLRRFHYSVNLGPGEARNRLLTEARGEFIAFQDADDVSLPERLARQVSALCSDPLLGLCGTFHESMAADGRRIRVFEAPLIDSEIRLEMRRRIPFLCATLMVRKSVLGPDRFRGFFNRIGCEDYDLAYRLTERSRAANIPRVLYRARVVPTSFSRTRRSRRQVYIDEVVRALARDRAETGTDCLMRNDTEALDRLAEELDRPYREDPALEFRRRAGAHVAVGEHATAVAAAVRAVLTRPGALVNYRALSYTLRALLRERAPL